MQDPKADKTTLTEGHSVGAKMACGIAHVINDVTHIHDFKEGEVLITEMTDPVCCPMACLGIASLLTSCRTGRQS